MARTYEDLMKHEKSKFKNPLTEKKGIVTRIKESLGGKVLYATVMVGTLIGVAEYHGATNPGQVQDTAKFMTTWIENRLSYDKNVVTNIADAVENTTPDNAIPKKDVGEILHEQRQAYADLLKKEPENKEAQAGLKKLDVLISTYEQTNNQENQ